MKFVILFATLLIGQQSIACPACAARAGDKTGYPSFVPMGPDGKAQYYGSRVDKTEVKMTEDKSAAAVPAEEKVAEKKKSSGSQSKNSKAKSN